MLNSLEPATLLEQLNWIDFCLLLALLGCLLVGFGMGFYRQLAVAGSLVVGFLLASRLSQSLAASDMFETVRAELGQSGAEGVAYGAIVLSSLLVGLASLLIFRNFFGATLKFVDSILGGALGLAVGCLLFGCFALGVYHFEESQFHAPIRQSAIGSQIADSVRVATRLFPDELRARIESGFMDPATVSSTDEPDSSSEESDSGQTGDVGSDPVTPNTDKK